MESFESRVSAKRTNLISGEDAETVDHLFGRVGVRRFACHEVQERIEVHVTGVVWIDDSQDTLEVDVTLPVFSDGVAQGHEARLEFIGSQSTRSVLVKVIETATEFVELFLRDALRHTSKF